MTDSSRNDEHESVPPSERADLTYSLDQNECPSEAVVRAVASLTGTPILDLEPLYEVIDPDHLDGLFGQSRGAEYLQNSSVSFSYNECTVIVTPDAVHVAVSASDSGE